MWLRLLSLCHNHGRSSSEIPTYSDLSQVSFKICTHTIKTCHRLLTHLHLPGHKSCDPTSCILIILNYLINSSILNYCYVNTIDKPTISTRSPKIGQYGWKAVIYRDHIIISFGFNDSWTIHLVPICLVSTLPHFIALKLSDA